MTYSHDIVIDMMYSHRHEELLQCGLSYACMQWVTERVVLRVSLPDPRTSPSGNKTDPGRPHTHHLVVVGVEGEGEGDGEVGGWRLGVGGWRLWRLEIRVGGKGEGVVVIMIVIGRWGWGLQQSLL